MRGMLPVVKGLATFVLPGSMYNRQTHGTDSARYCYSVLLRHLSMIDMYYGATEFRHVAEIGPGDSIGIGLAALLAGAERYDGFDVKHYDLPHRTEQILEELIRLFEARANIPDEVEFPLVVPRLEGYDFPSGVLSRDRMTRSLAAERLDEIRRSLRYLGDDSMIRYVAPWSRSFVSESDCVDWIFSQAVMEHVDELEDAYAACFSCLRPGGIMTHSIDFRSHGTAEQWNGHWARSDVAWWAIRGARPWLLNRESYSGHITLLEKSGFLIKGTQVEKRSDGIDRSQLVPRFRSMTVSDLETATAFIVAEKPNR